MEAMPDEKELSAYVGVGAEDYLKSWSPALKGEDEIGGFNIAAFIFSIFWLTFRKMYRYGFIWFGAFLAIAVLQDILFIVILKVPVPWYGMIIVGLPMAAVVGWFGNRWYFESARRAIRNIKAEGLSEAETLKRIAQQGGTNNLWITLGFVVLVVVEYIFAVYVPVFIYAIAGGHFPISK
jgi:hypothetical protein